MACASSFDHSATLGMSGPDSMAAALGNIRVHGCVTMSIDAGLRRRIGMGVDVSSSGRIDVRVDMSATRSIRMRVDVSTLRRVGMNVDMCLPWRVQMCVDMGARNVVMSIDVPAGDPSVKVVRNPGTTIVGMFIHSRNKRRVGVRVDVWH